ncbi:MAG TPA: alpha/beta hydrolase [Terriglobales bacterium]|nr:alpha/beta hydrolase [Terriglobales bacterium]
MPRVKIGSFTMNYDQQGTGEPLILIPHLAADHACYSFQLPEYSRHFTCFSVDLRGTGESDDPRGAYSTEDLGEDVAAWMNAVGIENAHIAGMSLGGAVGIWLAAKYPDKVKSLSVHGCWPHTDLFLKTVVEGWQTSAKALPSVAETLIAAIFPWCLTPETYAKPDYIKALCDFVRSRPPQSLNAFLEQSNAVATHNVDAQLGNIRVPTQITFGRFDLLTIRFAEHLNSAIENSELYIFEGCSHGALYENVAEFNDVTLRFLKARVRSAAA